MRNVFFALVLANLAFAAWAIWYDAPSPKPSTPRASGLPIRLVGEIEAGVEDKVEDKVASKEDEGAEANAGFGENAGSGETGSATPATSAPPASERGTNPPGANPPGPNDPGANDRGSSGPTSSSERVASAADTSGAAARAANASNVDARAADASDASDRCVSIGPFPTDARAEAAAAALAAAGYTSSSRSAEGEIWVGFWVHINAIPTRDEANAMLARLHENGLPDAYLIPGEEDGDIISLGVFNDMTRAGRLEQQVRRIGLVPVIAERSRPGIVRWLDVAVPAGRELDLDALGIRQDRIGQSPCPNDA
ncbi:MAG TPA: SPOR domain-containing protein [Gammaproteobacteria bacterium]